MHSLLLKFECNKNIIFCFKRESFISLILLTTKHVVLNFEREILNHLSDDKIRLDSMSLFECFLNHLCDE